MERKNLEKKSNINTKEKGEAEKIWKNTENKIKEILNIPTKTDTPEVTYYNIDESDLNTIKNLQKWYNENVYLKIFWEPQNVITFWDWNVLYTTNCLNKNDRKYIIWYIQKWNELKLRLFYKSKSEWARRSCPWAREGWWYSKWEDIPNSSYETSTKISYEIGCKFNALPQENIDTDPIKGPSDSCWYEILETEMNSEIHIEKLFKGYPNATCDSFSKKSVPEIINMYEHLWENFDINNMQYLKWCWYTYEHHYLWTIEVEIWRLFHNWKYLDFYFAKVKNDPVNRVRIEEVSYPEAKITSFWIYNKTINAAPLTWKPIEYSIHVPDDMKWNIKFPWSKYIDIRDLYQQNPLIKRFKKISKS